MTVDRTAALIVLLLPAAAAFCAGIWTVFTWAMKRHDDTKGSPIVQGQVIPAPHDQWADRAYAGIVRELDDERADHAHSINRHRSCHDAMRAAGLVVPDDH